MNISSKHAKKRYMCIPLLTTIVFALGSAHSAMAKDDTEQRSERVTISTLRAPGATETTVKTMRKKIDETKKTDRQTQEKNQQAQKKLQKNDGYVWVDYATVGFSGDLDNDGFYTSVSLDFDVDTDYDVIDVYARLFLSLEQGPWIEYTATDNFTISAFGDDPYFVDTDLVEGFPAGYYDLRIEIYDAADDYLFATFGPAESGELSYLPLEDEYEDSGYVNDQVVLVRDSGGGGSLGGVALLTLLMLAAVRMTKARR